MKRFFFYLFFGLTLFSTFALGQQNDAKSGDKKKTYAQMGFDEKLRFVSAKSDEILALFGRTAGDEIGAEGQKMIKMHLDLYVKRLSIPSLDSCSSTAWAKSDLTSVLKRGAQNAGAVNAEFSAQNMPPQIGLYTAMIESEFCPCLQSPTGALGMFQFTATLGMEYGLAAKKGAAAADSDDRCQPKLAARASAKYYKKIIDTIFGGDAVGFPLAVGAYNRGEGAMKKHITDVSTLTKTPRISFWVLMDTREQVAKKFEDSSAEDRGESTPLYLRQFEMENIKYVPKFFAAAIIGENPEAFGIEMMPLSRIK